MKITTLPQQSVLEPSNPTLPAWIKIFPFDDII